MDNDRHWSIGRMKDEGFDIVLRLRKQLPEWCNKNNYPHLIMISWPFNGYEGMPKSEDNIKQVEFEEILEHDIEKKHVGLLTLVVTGRDNKEWQWYTKDPKLFIEALNKSLPQDRALPIEINYEEDNDWLAYHKWNPA